MINQEEVIESTKKLELKNQCLDQIYVILVMRLLLRKELLLLLKNFVANDFMDLAENRRATSATTSNTANDAALDGKLSFKNNTPFVNCI